MSFVPLDKLSSELRERHLSFIQKMTEELHEAEVEFHHLNVQQIREEIRGGAF
jgi:hypothetical protein